jgi:hypothetical protein
LHNSKKPRNFTSINKAAMNATWHFVENYPGVGPCLVSGPCIVTIAKATQEMIDAVPEAVEWLKGSF